ncbi:MAG TPA: SDR family NAD(P)-dependent oxidoreductase, partial [Methylomirabilota bacterium]|nr:SDR family NAD(P)-dependent oxidoreductase [Methylomirabilota bacterium]
MDLGLTGKKAIVTGGSLGIGKAIARELAREGADVAVVSRTKDVLEAAASEIAKETGRRVEGGPHARGGAPTSARRRPLRPSRTRTRIRCPHGRRGRTRATGSAR